MTRLVVCCAAVALMLATSGPAASAPAERDKDLAARSRPHVTVHPRHYQPGPNAKRHCRAWLQKQYRVSGTVIVPQMRCWWD